MNRTEKLAAAKSLERGMWWKVLSCEVLGVAITHMSRGYTIAFAMTAPVAPATARPHGGIDASFDCPAIAATDEEST